MGRQRKAKTLKEPREVKSVKIYADIHHKADVYASQQRRNLQDVLSEAIAEYLKKHGA